MTFEQWKVALAIEIEKIFEMHPFEGTKYIDGCGDECWREMFDEGLTPVQAAEEEAYNSDA